MMISSTFFISAVLVLLSLTSSAENSTDHQVDTMKPSPTSTAEEEGPTIQPPWEHRQKKNYSDGSPKIQPHPPRKKHFNSAFQPPLESHTSKEDSPSNIRRNLILGIGIGLGILLLAGITYLFYYIYKAAVQQQQMVQQTLTVRAFVESFPIHLIEHGVIYECPVCMCEFAGGSNLRLLPSCSHIFCIDCIIRVWEDVSQPSLCPLCRHPYEVTNV